MPEIVARPYRHGELSMVPVAEPDPFGFWMAEVESNAKGMTSYEIDGALVAVTYYMPMWDGVAEGVALVNRALAAGAGKELAKAVRQRIDELMTNDRLHRVQATSEPADRASRVFLRAIGYRYESTMRRAAPDQSDLDLYVILESRA